MIRAIMLKQARQGVDPPGVTLQRMLKQARQGVDPPGVTLQRIRMLLKEL